MDNRALDHWLRANFPTGLATDATWADSHFDVVSRAIAIADSTGWVERAGGTHPLRTFVAMSDGRDGLSLMPKGIFEYEAFEDDARTLALTLVRWLPHQTCRERGKADRAARPGRAMRRPAAVRVCRGRSCGELVRGGHPAPRRGLCGSRRARPRSGRGRGALPDEFSLLLLDNANVHVTAVKQAEDGRGLIVRLFNTTATEQSFTLTFGRPIASASLCKIDEERRGGGRGFRLPLDRRRPAPRRFARTAWCWHDATFPASALFPKRIAATCSTWPRRGRSDSASAGTACAAS